MAGATFAEVMLASMVLGAAVVASTASMRGSTEVYHYFAEGPHEALMLAQEIHEAAVLLPWEADEDAEEIFGDAKKLDDIDGATYGPPRSAEYEVVVRHSNWSQEVEVMKVDLADPSVEIDPETFEGEILTELKVTIFNGPTEIGVFSWWMSEPDEADE